MGANTDKPRPSETVRKIAEQALGDAVEITLLINLIEGQNAGGVNKKLDEGGASRAAIVLRNALIARLVTLIARAYSKPKNGDLHVHVAVGLLKDNVTRQIFGSRNGLERLATFENHWTKCHGDHRLPLVKHFRDKFTVHLGEPKDIPDATYSDLFAFGTETAKGMELLALAAGVALETIDAEPDLISSPRAFWSPWNGG